MLTIESAKEYVKAYHARIGETVDIEGAGLIHSASGLLCRLNCTVEDAGGRFVAQWDVWVEHSDLYGDRLYGEF